MSDVFAELRRSSVADDSQLQESWEAIKETVAKTLLAIHPTLYERYSLAATNTAAGGPKSDGGGVVSGPLPGTCFQLIGVDLLLDADLTPWLIEINHNPSLTCDTAFDRDLKGGVVGTTLELLNVQQYDKKAHRQSAARWLRARKEKAKANTPLEKERLQQQKLKDQRTAARHVAKPSAAAAGSTAAPTGGGGSEASSAEAPESAGLFERVLGGGDGGSERFALFSSTALLQCWRAYVGVRKQGLSAVRWARLLRDQKLLGDRFSNALADRSFRKAIMSSGVDVDDAYAASASMGFQDFLDGFVAMAAEEVGTHSGRVSGGAGDLVGALTDLLRRLETHQPSSRQAPEPPPLACTLFKPPALAPLQLPRRPPALEVTVAPPWTPQRPSVMRRIGDSFKDGVDRMAANLPQSPSKQQRTSSAVAAGRLLSPRGESEPQRPEASPALLSRLSSSVGKTMGKSMRRLFRLDSRSSQLRSPSRGSGADATVHSPRTPSASPSKRARRGLWPLGGGQSQVAPDPEPSP